MLIRRLIRLLSFALVLAPIVARADERLDAALDAIVTRLYAEKPVDELRALTPEQLAPYITPADADALATAYWRFDVNVPVVVSVMRHVKQATPPAWLAETGFTKTGMMVKNENCDYEVWQKQFDAGPVALGINGLDGHRFCYFVCVGPQTPGVEVRVTNAVPADPPIGAMQVGAMTYIDWTELVLTEVPEPLRGHVLLTTYRGRARECHLFGGFRETPFPSTDRPDQITLTWNEDPKTTQAVLWRTNTSTTGGTVRYRERTAPNVRAIDVRASLETIDDRMLANDRTSHRFTGVMRNLKPGTTYAYKVGDSERGVWSEEFEFTTAPDNGDTFSFVHLTDTHNREVAGQMLAAAYAREPRPSLVTISGDLVDMGLHRDCWDKLFAYLGEPIARIPVIPSTGNHDDQDGLGPGTFLKQFALPDARFEGLPAERVCAIRYANALFLVIPIGLSVETIGAWLEKELASTDATWKFGVYHFPMYSQDPEYAGYYEKQHAIWGAIFDKYHLDFMLTGHTHAYERRKPIYAGKEVDSPNEGTVYLVSAPGHYSTFDISGNRLEFRTIDAKGNTKDAISIAK